MDAEKYVYTALEDASAQIRLLKVRPRTDANQILRCKLEVYDAEDAAKLGYTALSYTWGESTPSQQIYIDGRALEARENLYEFLAVAAAGKNHFSRRTLLWIDQICIDQSNNSEKQRQVSRMDRIYKDARDVIIWLGTGSPGSDELIRSTKRTSPGFSVHFCVSEYPKMLDHWAKLVQIPYWTRLWICQEIILAKAITLWIGNSHILWDQFQYRAGEMDLLQKIMERGGVEHGAGCLKRLVDVRSTQDKSTRRGQLDWDRALNAQKGSACCLRHDKIFGLLGLVREDLKIEVDYQIPMRDLFYRVLDKQIIDYANWQSWAYFRAAPELQIFAKDLRYELGLKYEVTDAELGKYLGEKLVRCMLDFRSKLGWRKSITNPWHAHKIRRWSTNFPSIINYEGFDWNDYNDWHSDDWKALDPMELM